MRLGREVLGELCARTNAYRDHKHGCARKAFVSQKYHRECNELLAHSKTAHGQAGRIRKSLRFDSRIGQPAGRV